MSATIAAALEYGARYCEQQAKAWARQAMYPARGRIDLEFRQEALANEKAFEDKAYEMRMLLIKHRKCGPSP